MRRGPGRHRLHDAWWTLILFAVIGVAVLVTAVSFTGSLRSTVPVTLTADRSGLVMDSGAKVMMRGVQVGRVAQIGRIEWAQNGASLRLEIDPDQIRYIPANVEAQISATTAFGAKFVDLVMPQNPSRARLSAGAVLHSKNVSTEINTVFENVVDLLNMIDPLKLNAVLTAVADAVRGQGERIGQATTDLNEVLEALNARGDTIGGNWRSLKNFTDTYDAAAQDILTILNAASTTSATVVNHSTQLDALLLNAIGLSNAGTNCLAAAETISSARPTSWRRPRACCSSTTPNTPASCRAPSGISTTAAMRPGAGPTGARYNSMWRYCSATTPMSIRTTCRLSRPRGVPAEGRDAGHCRMPPTTSRCASWSPTPDGEPGWTSGPTPASGIPAGPTTSR